MLRQLFYFLGLMLIPVVLYANYAIEECTPAKKPDLNNDGIVNYKDLWAVGHSFGLSKNDFRFIVKADTNCDGQVNDSDWDYVWQAYNKIYSIFPEVDGYISIFKPNQFHVGEEAHFESHITISSAKSPFTFKLTQQITPSEGLLIKTNFDNSLFKVDQKEYSHYFWHQEFPIHLKAEKVGKYQFILRAEIPEEGKVITETATIEVLPAKVLPTKNPQINIVLSVSQYHGLDDSGQPDLDIDQIYYGLKVNFKITGKDIALIEKTAVIDETDGQSYPENQYHKNQLDIPEKLNFFQNKQCKSIHALITTPNAIITSKSVKYCGKPMPPEALRNCNRCHQVNAKPLGLETKLSSEKYRAFAFIHNKNCKVAGKK